MACFTIKTTIPFVQTDAEEELSVKTTLVGDHGWILFEDEVEFDVYEKQLFKFHTDWLTLEKVNCQFPGETCWRIVEITSDGSNIYAIFETSYELRKRKKSELFKFDVTTLRWEFMMHFRQDNHVNYGPIIKDHLFFIEYPDIHEIRLMSTNLISKKIVEIPFNYIYGTVSFMENDGQLFVKEMIPESSTIIVSKINNEKIEKLDEYCYDNFDGTKMMYVKFAQITNGHLLKSIKDGWSPQNSPSELWKICANYLEWFDFTTNRWKRAVLPERDEAYVSRLIVKDEKCFGIFEESWVKHKYSIQMIELRPKLSTICIMSQIDKTNDAKDFEGIKDRLSIPLRNKLENILKWKIVENDIRLGKEQKAEVLQELLRMEDDEVVDRQMQRKLQMIFDSDFSDQSDSDITDGEDESFDDSNDEQDDDTKFFNDERRMWWSEDDHHVPDGSDVIVAHEYWPVVDDNSNSDDSDATYSDEFNFDEFFREQEDDGAGLEDELESN